jgi:hypothetical protein
MKNYFFIEWSFSGQSWKVSAAHPSVFSGWVTAYFQANCIMAALIQEPLRHQSADISAHRSKDDAEIAVSENDKAFYRYLN